MSNQLPIPYVHQPEVIPPGGSVKRENPYPEEEVFDEASFANAFGKGIELLKSIITIEEPATEENVKHVRVTVR